MSERNESISSLNDSLDLDEVQEALDGRLAMELLEERLELGCWVQCSVCMLLCNAVS